MSEKRMEQITKEEAKYLESRGVWCPKTCRLKNNGTSRGKAYAPDDKSVQELLSEYRKTVKVVYTYGQID